MAAITILTKSGGSIDFSVNRSGITGTNLYLHIDQSYNLKNGEGEAAILLTSDECKDVIASLNDYIKFIEGKDFVFTSDSVENLISHPKVQETLLALGYTKGDNDSDDNSDLNAPLNNNSIIKHFEIDENINISLDIPMA